METWMPVYGFENYEVSNMGNVRRIAHIAKHARYGDRKMPERSLNPRKNGDGYWRVKIGGVLRFVHVLVLESFVSQSRSSTLFFGVSHLRFSNLFSSGFPLL